MPNPTLDAAFLGLSSLLLSSAPAWTASAPSFQEKSTGLPTGNYAAVAMADLDGDGRAEMLSGRRDGEEGLFLFAFKNGAWNSQKITGQGEYGGVALVDVTGDSIPDVLAVKTMGRPRGLEIFQTGKNGLQLHFTPLPSPFTEVGCDDLAVGDIESDGDLDIAISTGGKGVQVFLNDGTGISFRNMSLNTDTYEDTGIALGDVNGDGRLDIIAANHPGKNPRLFICSKTGEVSYGPFQAEGLAIGPAIGYRSAFVDLNGDDLTDLAVGTSNGVQVFLGNGCRGAASGWWKTHALTDRGAQTMQVSVGDLDNSGQPDLAFSSDRGIMVFLNKGKGVFSERLSAGLPQSGEFSGCLLQDWDGDGDLDLACSSFQGLGVKFFENQAGR